MTEHYYNDSIFWVEVGRISPNPYQPRKSFDEAALASLAESIRQYGVLQPLTVTRKEVEKPGEGISVEYELIAGERRLRAAQIAGVGQVPVVIRSGEETDKMKLELAIIENLQREDLNPIDRAKAFQQLVDEFGLKHTEVAKRVGKSREYVSNTLRMLTLPKTMQEALTAGGIMEGHTRPLLMLTDRPEQQQVLFQEIMDKKMTVREAEKVARRIAVERARKHDLSPELMTLEKELTETLGTRVTIEAKEKGGKVHIDFFSPEDLEQIRALVLRREEREVEQVVPAEQVQDMPAVESEASQVSDVPVTDAPAVSTESTTQTEVSEIPEVSTPAQEKEPEDDLYSVKNFTV